MHHSVYFQCFFQYCVSREFTTFYYHNWIKLCIAYTFFTTKGTKDQKVTQNIIFKYELQKNTKLRVRCATLCPLVDFVVEKKCGKKSFVVSLHRVNKCAYSLQRRIWIYPMTQVDDVFPPKLADHFVCIMSYFSG